MEVKILSHQNCCYLPLDFLRNWLSDVNIDSICAVDKISKLQQKKMLSSVTEVKYLSFPGSSQNIRKTLFFSRTSPSKLLLKLIY